MNLEKAIEILQFHSEWVDLKKDVDLRNAVRLGIEGLKVIKAIRPYSNSNKSYFLPGETEQRVKRADAEERKAALDCLGSRSAESFGIDWFTSREAVGEVHKVNGEGT